MPSGIEVEALAVLRSIDGSLKSLLALSQQRRQAPDKISRGGAVASDRDLDGRFGDPEVKFMPRDWTGHSYKGRKFSECPPDLLDMLAETFEYFGIKADEKREMTEKGKPVGDYKRLDAARARGWAARIRSGKHQHGTQESDEAFAQAEHFGGGGQW